MNDAPGPRVRPSGWWYVLVPVLLMAGFGFGIVAAVDEGRSVADSFSTLGVDGRGTVELDEGDTATVLAFWEDGRSTETITRPQANVSITGPDGDEVMFEPARNGRQTFSFDNRSGIDLGTFEATTTGSHQIRVVFSRPDALAAVGRLDWQAIIGRVLRPVLFGAAAAVVWWITLLVLRGSSKRAHRAPGSPQSGGPFV